MTSLPKGFSQETIGGLECLVKTPQEVTADKRVSVLVLHGYGADNRDLTILSEVLPQVKNIEWIFPNGPLKIPIGPHQQGRAWFEIDLIRLQAAEEGGRDDLLETHRPPGMGNSKKSLLKLIDERKIDSDKLIIIGFSQGSMMSLEVALNFSKSYYGFGAVLISHRRQSGPARQTSKVAWL